MLTNLIAFKDVSMDCKNAVLYGTLLKNCTINSLAYEENTRQPSDVNLCLSDALALFLHGNGRQSEETSTIFISIMNLLSGLSPNRFKGVHTNDTPVDEDLLKLNTLLYDIDFVYRNIIGEPCRQSVQIYEKI